MTRISSPWLLFGVTSVVGCGFGSDEIVLDGPGPAIDGARDAASASVAFASVIGAFDDVKLTRIDFPAIADGVVRTACAVALDGVRIGPVLDEDACAEDEKAFSKRLDADRLYGPALAHLDLGADDEVNIGPLSFIGADKASTLAALNVVDAKMDLAMAKESVASTMVLKARAGAVGVEADVFGCAANYSSAMATLLLDAVEAECTHASRAPSDGEVAGQLKSLAKNLTEAQQGLEAGMRKEAAWTGSCAGATATVVGTFPEKVTVPITFEVETPSNVVVVSLLAGETVTGVFDRDYIATLYLVDANCTTRGIINSEHRVRETGTYGIYVKGYDPTYTMATFELTTDGKGGPSEEQKATWTAYIHWFDTTFPGVTSESVEADAAAAVKQAGAGGETLKAVVAGSREGGIACAAKKVANKYLVARSFAEAATRACAAELAAAVDARIAGSGKPLNR